VAGARPITVVYSGDTNYASSISAILSQVINKATSTTTITSSPNPSTYGQAVTFNVTVLPQYKGVPTGTVTLTIGATTLTTLSLVGGTASYATSTLPIGTNTINAKYNSSVNLKTSSTTINQTVSP
jgi:hypothetical protein